MSCAKNGDASGIVFKVLREIEKEVILMDNQMVPPDDPTLQSSNDISTQVVQSSGDSNPSPMRSQSHATSLWMWILLNIFRYHPLQSLFNRRLNRLVLLHLLLASKSMPPRPNLYRPTLCRPTLPLSVHHHRVC